VVRVYLNSALLDHCEIFLHLRTKRSSYFIQKGIPFTSFELLESIARRKLLLMFYYSTHLFEFIFFETLGANTHLL
jgi:hypothetical protein